MAEYRKNTMHTPTRSHRLDLHYIPPVPLVELNRIWQETRSSTVMHPIHDIILINLATI